MTSKSPVGDISDVTLIRTDTTLDHSQKAEKVWIKFTHSACQSLLGTSQVCVRTEEETTEAAALQNKSPLAYLLSTRTLS